MSSSEIVLAFDLYGTLLDTTSIAAKLSEYFGKEQGPALAAKWRLYQLEYTWRLNSMERYEPFSDVTRKSLAHTLTEANLSLSEHDTEALLRAYDSLSTFPDVKPALTALASMPGVMPLVFSNGTNSMVSNSVYKSADLSPHAKVFKDIVTVEDPKRFKPAPIVYQHLAQKVGKSEDNMDQMWLVSGNPFDIVGARAMGMKAAWVSRSGGEWVDRLGQEPTVIIRSLEELPAAIKKYSSS